MSLFPSPDHGHLNFTLKLLLALGTGLAIAALL
jgi:hypothetical protein